MAEHVQKYIEQTTLSAFPFIRRLNKAYIESFLHDSDWFATLRQLDSFFDPTQSWFLFNELDPKAKSFSGQEYLPLLAYAIDRKDLTGLQIFANILKLGVAEYRYGDRLFGTILDATDPARQAATDEGYTTDMTASSYPVMVIFLDYAQALNTGIDDLPEVWSRAQSAAGLVTLIKPARTPLIYLRRPNYVVSRFGNVGTTCYDLPDWGAIDALTPEQRSGLYTSIDAVTPDKYWSGLLYKSETKRIWWVFSDSPIHTVTIQPGNSSFEVIRVVPQWDPSIFEPQSGSDVSVNFNKYCCRVCLNLSNDVNDDNFSEVLNG